MKLYDKLLAPGSADASALAPLRTAPLPLERRDVRVLVLLFVIAVLNAVDLAYTLLAHRIGWLIEMNPIADTFLAQGFEPSLICYKLLMVLVGSAMLWKMRACRWAAPACWVVVIAYAWLALWWYLWGREVLWMYHAQRPFHP